MKLPEDVREFFRQQGRIGGKRRLVTIPAARRRDIARQAVQTRWAKAKSKPKPIRKPRGAK